MKTQIQTFLKDETGVTAIEYGLIAGLIAAALLTVIGTLSGSLKDVFTKIQGAAAAAATAT